MQIRPIFAALRKHRLATLLITLEIALACAVLCNACFLVIQRWQLIHIDSGVDENALAVITVNGFCPGAGQRPQCAHARRPAWHPRHAVGER